MSDTIETPKRGRGRPPANRSKIEVPTPVAKPAIEVPAPIVANTTPHVEAPIVADTVPHVAVSTPAAVPRTMTIQELFAKMR